MRKLVAYLGQVRTTAVTGHTARLPAPGFLSNTRFLFQKDVHMALLTVRETFQFALDNAVSCEYGDVGAAAASARRVETMLKLLDLEECADTSVGSDLVRGISGGQRKRVSIGEVLITNARALLLDEYSTGLDTSTTYDITASIVSWAKHLDGVFIGSLLQPPPEVYSLFDNVLLLKEGRCVYCGPREALRPYLQGIGWDIPDDEDEADFLVELLADSHGAWEKLQRSRQLGETAALPPTGRNCSAPANSRTRIRPLPPSSRLLKWGLLGKLKAKRHLRHRCLPLLMRLLCL